MSLYSKYRPQNFANLVGQDHIRLTLLHEIQQGTLTHAYLFTGPRGTGKTSTARLIAKALNCQKKNDEGEPCDTCDFCKSIVEGSLIDVIEIDAASNRGIDEIRDLKEKIKFAPTRAKTKVYIIDEVHMLTKEAFNALLKTLEEPPENVYFILCTTEIHKIPETIISRCQRFDFKRIDVRTIMTRLNYITQMEKIEAEDAAIELIARHVEGGLRDAIGIMEQMTIDHRLLADHVRSHLGITGHETIENLLSLLEKREIAKAIQLINEIYREGYDLTALVREILECLRERLVSSIQHDTGASSLWLSMISHFEEAREMLRSTVIPQLPLEIAAIKICGPEGKSELEPPSKIIEGKEQNLSPAIRETAEAQKAEEKTASVLKQEYGMEQYQGDLMSLWPRVLEHMQPPSLRRSLTDGKIIESTDSTLTLKFCSRFHMEKVNIAVNKVKIEKAILHLTGKNLKVMCELDVARIETDSVNAPRETKKSKNSSEDLAKKAIEMFQDM